MAVQAVTKRTQNQHPASHRKFLSLGYVGLLLIMLGWFTMALADFPDNSIPHSPISPVNSHPVQAAPAHPPIFDTMLTMLTAVSQAVGADKNNKFSFDGLATFIGALFVIFYSWGRFNDPKTIRSSTTQARYFFSNLSYTMVYLSIFAVLVKYSSVINVLFAGDTELQQQFNDLPHALVAALLLTGFLQKIPVLQQSDKWLRDNLQRLASIPFEVRRLAKQLCNTEFQIDKNVQEIVYKHLREDGLFCDAINFEDRTESYWLWNKASVLMYELSLWEQRTKMSNFMTQKASEYKDIKVQYNNLSDLAKSCLEFSSKPAEPGKDNSALIELTRTFQEQCRTLIRSQCEFISHGILRHFYSYKSRAAELRGMGFLVTAEDTSNQLTLNQITSLFLALAIGVSTLLVLYNQVFEINAVYFRYLILAIIQAVVAVAVVVYTKHKWAISRRDERNRLPVFYYLVAGLFTVALCFPVSFAYRSMYEMMSTATASASKSEMITEKEIKASKQQSAQKKQAAASAKGKQGKDTEAKAEPTLLGQFIIWFGKSLRWKISAFLIAFVLAWQLDISRIGSLTYPRLRWLDGAVQAGAGMIGAGLTYLFMSKNMVGLDWLMLRGAIIGFIIGCTIPYWYKVAPRGITTEPDEEDALIRNGSALIASQKT